MGRTQPEDQKIQTIDHKFDYIEVEQFVKFTCYLRTRYTLVFFSVIKMVLVYIIEIILLVLTFVPSLKNGASIQTQLESNDLVDLNTRKYIIAATIGLSFLVLFWDVRKSRRIISSKDISLAYFDRFSYWYYSLRSYAHFCLFRQLQTSRKAVDLTSFFVFFTLKGWKRLILAETPRYILNAITLKEIFTTEKETRNLGSYFDVIGALLSDAYGGGSNAAAASARTRAIFAILSGSLCIIWAIGVILTIIAVFAYFPVVAHIKGNLKEWCCRRIDKRIAHLIQSRSQKRIEKLRQEEKMERNRFGGASNQFRGLNMSAMKDIESDRDFDTQSVGSSSNSSRSLKSSGPTLPVLNVDLTKTSDSLHSVTSMGSQSSLVSKLPIQAPQMWYPQYPSQVPYYAPPKRPSLPEYIPQAHQARFVAQNVSPHAQLMRMHSQPEISAQYAQPRYASQYSDHNSEFSNTNGSSVYAATDYSLDFNEISSELPVSPQRH